MTEFFAMDGYAAYVWSSFGISLLVLLVNVWWAHWRLKKTLAGLRRSSEEPEAPRRPVVRELS